MKWLLEIIKAVMAAWFSQKRKDTDQQELKSKLEAAEADYEKAKAKRQMAITDSDWAACNAECRRLSETICDLRSRIRQSES